LEILIAEGAARGLDPDNLLGLFKKLGKQQHDGPKVIVTVTVGPLR
jgi:retrograde regulation protein 2